MKVISISYYKLDIVKLDSYKISKKDKYLFQARIWSYQNLMIENLLIIIIK